MPHQNYPPPIQWRRDALNHTVDGVPMYPSATFLSKCVAAENHLTAHRHKELFSADWQLGSRAHALAGTNTIRRFRVHTGHGATRLRVMLTYGKTYNDGLAVPTAPYIQLDVTLSGGATTTVGAWRPTITATLTGLDAPSNHTVAVATVDVDPNSIYEGALIVSDYARPLGISVCEIGDATVSESTLYYNQSSPQAGAPIYDADRSRLLVGVDGMLRHNGGTAFHFGMRDGSTRTRTSATQINLVDNASTGNATAASPGFHVDMTYRRTSSRTQVPAVMHVYAAIAGGASGSLNLIDSAGSSWINCAINAAGPQWFSGNGFLDASAKKYDLQYGSDGVNQITVYAVSVIEWEA